MNEKAMTRTVECGGWGYLVRQHQSADVQGEGAGGSARGRDAPVGRAGPQRVLGRLLRKDARGQLILKDDLIDVRLFISLPSVNAGSHGT